MENTQSIANSSSTSRARAKARTRAPSYLTKQMPWRDWGFFRVLRLAWWGALLEWLRILLYVGVLTATAYVPLLAALGWGLIGFLISPCCQCARQRSPPRASALTSLA